MQYLVLVVAMSIIMLIMSYIHSAEGGIRIHEKVLLAVAIFGGAVGGVLGARASGKPSSWHLPPMALAQILLAASLMVFR